MMNTIGQPASLSKIALIIFDYLAREEASTRRTREAVLQHFKASYTPAEIDAALKQLEQRKLFVVTSDAYALSPEGKKLAVMRSGHGHASGSIGMADQTDRLQTLKIQERTPDVLPKTAVVATPSPNSPLYVIADDAEMERTTRQALKDLPAANQHPLRNPHAPLKQQVVAANTMTQRKLFVRQNEIYFMLGFVDRRDVPPVPVLDGDLLGRDPHAHIYLRHDNAISHRQCEFQVRVAKNGAMQLWVKYLRSLNGTYINRAPIDPDRFVFVPARAHLRIGNTTLTVIQIYWDATDGGHIDNPT